MNNSNQNTKNIAASYLDIKRHVINKGFSWEVDWQENQCIKSLNESEFFREAAWVILSSGMSVRSVTSVFNEISNAFLNWEDSEKIVNLGDNCINQALKHFNHKGKINAILSIIQHVNNIGFEVFKFELIDSGVEYIQQFSFFGPATSFHLAKNIGMNVVKPDRHLIRLAEALNFPTPYELCKVIANLIDEKLSVVDVVLWRYCVMNPNYLAMIQRFKTYA
ncbi:MAG: hypothetical protein K8R54_19195 [Bacteroidales bacterium]|nr:hypothetical protein [Bacteroidales bacterium]